MVRYALVIAAALCAAPAFAQENAWQAYLKEQQEISNRNLAEADAKLQEARKATLESVKGIRPTQTLIEPTKAYPTFRELEKPQLRSVEPKEAPKTRSYLISTGNGMKLCHETAGVVRCN